MSEKKNDEVVFVSPRQDNDHADAAERENELLMEVSEDPHQFALFVRLHHSPAAAAAAAASSSSFSHPRVSYAEDLRSRSAAIRRHRERTRQAATAAAAAAAAAPAWPSPSSSSATVAWRAPSFSLSDLGGEACCDANGLARMREDMRSIDEKIRQINERNRMTSSMSSSSPSSVSSCVMPEDEEAEEAVRQYQNFNRRFQERRRRADFLKAIWRSFLAKLRFFLCLGRGC